MGGMHIPSMKAKLTSHYHFILSPCVVEFGESKKPEIYQNITDEAEK